MNDELAHLVAADEAGERLDRVVARITGASRALAKELVESGAARLDGARVPPAARVPSGSRVSVRWSRPGGGLIAGTAPFEVAYEDEGFLVVDKPAGVVVHPGAGHDSDTLVNALVGPYPELGHLGPERNWGLVHRLDRDTSGLLLVARDAAVRDRLQAQLRRREITRRYLALTAGRRFDNATGTIEAPIGRDPERPTRMAVVADGRPSRTHYVRLASWPDGTLLEVTLDTGRTHQIRVHLAAISAPVVGDRTYGGGDVGGLTAGRSWLHAFRLVFSHPGSGRRIDVRSPLPGDLSEVIEALGPPEEGSIPEVRARWGRSPS